MQPNPDLAANKTGWLGAFSTAELDMAKASQTEIVSSARAYLKLSVTHDLAKLAALATPYRGCDINEYTRLFSYEFAGAARSASDLAIYSYIAAPDDAQLAESAKLGARHILSAWAGEAQHLTDLARNDLAGFCEGGEAGRQGTRFSVGLVFGRGMPYLVTAFAVLEHQHALTNDETARITQFFGALYDIEIAAMNYRATKSNLDCNRFNNHVSVQIAALAIFASIQPDAKRLQSVADGVGGSVAIPWTLQVSKTIYGEGATLLNCFSNEVDAKHYYQNQTPQAGEVVDRYRAGAEQTVGYPLFSLEHILLAARVFQYFHYDELVRATPVRDHIANSLDFYAQLLIASINKKNLAEDVRFRQYDGKVIMKGCNTFDGADMRLASFVIGSSIYPEDKSLKTLMNLVMSSGCQHELPLSALPGMLLPVIAEVDPR